MNRSPAAKTVLARGALLALARKVIVTDLTSLSAAWLAALMASLGITHWAVARARPR